MKIISVIIKSIKEQLRSFWVLILTLTMGPFFIFLYYLFTVTSDPHYNILVLNADKGMSMEGLNINYGEDVKSYFISSNADTSKILVVFSGISDKNGAIEKLKEKQADALIIIPESFSADLVKSNNSDSTVTANIEFMGDLSNTNYLISAVWANEMLNEYILRATKSKRIVEVKETAVGLSANVSNFDMIVPGILIVSIIMMMFTASIAFVSEVENKTIMRLKLSKLSAFDFLSGIFSVQLVVGIISAMLTLATAFLLGFHYGGSLAAMTVVIGITCLSIIAFSLILAAVTRSANEILVVGCFPMFLFMFFTGAAFPLKSDAWFTIAGYPVNLQGLMSPTHATSALNKILIMNMDMRGIIPEIISILVLTALYFLIGAVSFKKRHLKLA